MFTWISKRQLMNLSFIILKNLDSQRIKINALARINNWKQMVGHYCQFFRWREVNGGILQGSVLELGSYSFIYKWAGKQDKWWGDKVSCWYSFRVDMVRADCEERHHNTEWLDNKSQIKVSVDKYEVISLRGKKTNYTKLCAPRWFLPLQDWDFGVIICSCVKTSAHCSLTGKKMGITNY